MGRAKNLAMAIVACVASAVAARSASATIVLVTDAASGWTVTRTTSSAPEGTQDYRTMPYDGTPMTTSAVLVSSPNGLWTAGSDPRLSTAKWITALASSGTTTSDPFSTRYVFQTSFNVSQPSNLNLAFAADNLVDTLVLSTAPNGGGTILGNYINTVSPIGDQSSGTVGRINGFVLGNVQSLTAVGFGTIYITATMYNYGGPPVTGHFPDGSSYGFILSADATPVPEPAAILMLAAPVIGLMMRRRREAYAVI